MISSASQKILFTNHSSLEINFADNNELRKKTHM